MSYAEIEASTAYQLWQATNAWQRRIRKSLEPLGLTHVQYIILASIDLLSERKEPPTQIEVSRFGGLDVNMTSQVLRGLEKKGWVERKICPEDKRAHRLSLTEEGRNIRLKAKAQVKPAAHSFFEPLGQDGEVLTALLRRLNAESSK